MITDNAIRRAQLYCFLADAFLYPAENWLEDLPALTPILRDLELAELSPPTFDLQLSELQSEHRRSFGLTGSLCYETEYGLPNEYRLSQELADIAGFYQAFGFKVGGLRRERPDHLATELEFLYVLALKEVYAIEQGIDEHIEVCIEARRSFLQDHIGRWIGFFAESLAKLADSLPDSIDQPQPYVWLARLAAAFVQAEAQHLGLSLDPRQLSEVKHTPIGPEISCDACPEIS